LAQAAHAPAPALDAALDELLQWGGAAYGGVAFEPVSAAGLTLDVLQIADMSAYLDSLVGLAGSEGRVELPLWSKVWPSALVLAHALSRLKDRSRPVLEIGAGVGVTGLFAAALGFDVLITDVNEDALCFARAAVLKNGLGDRARVARVDFSADRLGRRFSLVLGSEVLYLPDLHAPLINFLLAHLDEAPGSEILLSCNRCRGGTAPFFKLAASFLTRDEKTIGCTAPGEGGGPPERHLVTIHRLRRGRA
jgi:predicted nicotinamide N-methyase